MNFTLSLDEKLVKEVRKMVVERDTTLTGLVLYGDRRRKTHDFHENTGSGLKKFVAKFRSFL